MLKPSTPESRHKKKRVYTKYPEVKDVSSSKFLRGIIGEIPPVYKIVSKSKDRNPTTVLSDDEYNDVELNQEISFDMSENNTDIDPNRYDTLKLSIVKVIFGDNDLELEELRFCVDTTLQKLSIFKGNETMIDIDLMKLTENIYFSETKVLLVLNKDIQVKNCKSNTFLFYSGKTYTTHWKSLWRKLKATRNDRERFYKEVTSNELLRRLRDLGLLNLFRNLGGSSAGTPFNTSKNTLAKKEFSSLQRTKPLRLSGTLGKPSRILTPKNTLSKLSSPSTATPPRQFYSPNTEATIRPIRLTRSQDKGSRSSTPDVNDSILIDDPDTVSRKSARGRRREVFKPSLAYKFKDNSFYKIKNIDFQCLYRGQWINDTLLDFFIKYFAENAIDNGFIKKEHLHIFTTFFFTKLISSTDYYENIKRWVSKIDFSNVKYTIVPINENLHWYCSIIVGFDKILQKDDTDSICCIYVFDSLRQDHQSILKPIRTFLLNYAKDKFDLDIDPERIKLKPSAVPKQPNFNDCGVHVMYNVLRFFESPKGCLDIWNTENNPTRVALATFFKKKDREEMREKLRKILKQLQSEQEHRDHDSDKELSDDDEDDIVYIDAQEFNDLKNKGQNAKESSTESQQKVENQEGEKPNSETNDAGGKDGENADEAKDKQAEEPEAPTKDTEEEGERFFQSSQDEEQHSKEKVENQEVMSQESQRGPSQEYQSAEEVQNEQPAAAAADDDADSRSNQKNDVLLSQESITQLESLDSQESMKPDDNGKSKEEPYEEVPATQETEGSQNNVQISSELVEQDAKTDEKTEVEDPNSKNDSVEDAKSPAIVSSLSDDKEEDDKKVEEDVSIQNIEAIDTEKVDDGNTATAQNDAGSIGQSDANDPPLTELASSAVYTVLEDSAAEEDHDVVMEEVESEVEKPGSKRGRPRKSRSPIGNQEIKPTTPKEPIDVEKDSSRASSLPIRRKLRASSRLSSSNNRAQEPIDVDMEHASSQSNSKDEPTVLDLSNQSDDAEVSESHTQRGGNRTGSRRTSRLRRGLNLR